MYLKIDIKRGAFGQKGPYYHCCGLNLLGASNLMAHLFQDHLPDEAQGLEVTYQDLVPALTLWERIGRRLFFGKRRMLLTPAVHKNYYRKLFPKKQTVFAPFMVPKLTLPGISEKEPSE
jgi:hypothetical protein